MKVHIILVHEHYDHSDIVEVFLNEEFAQKQFEALKDTVKKHHSHHFTMERWEVDEAV